jgi:hypothetical protein
MARVIDNPQKFADELENKIEDLIKKRVLEGEFIRELDAGTLPLKVLQGWAKNWYTFALEINSSISCLYHRFGSLCKRHPDVEDIFTQRIGEELSYPGPGGHIRTMEGLGKALGVTRTDMIENQLCAVMLNEKAQGSTVFSRMCQSLRKPPYNLTEKDLYYLSLHGEVDIDHGEINKQLLVKMLDYEPIQERAGFGMEYCALMWAEMFCRVYDGVYRAYRN